MKKALTIMLVLIMLASVLAPLAMAETPEVRPALRI